MLQLYCLPRVSLVMNDLILSNIIIYSYSLLDVNVTTLEDGGPNLPGIISYATRGVRKRPIQLLFN
jgi:hypothetical protein